MKTVLHISTLLHANGFLQQDTTVPLMSHLGLQTEFFSYKSAFVFNITKSWSSSPLITYVCHHG